MNMRTHAPVLGNLVIRIFETPTNSVASKHTFSIQNHLHSKLRSSLLSKTVNKLTYTYINGRLLRNIELLKGGHDELAKPDLTEGDEVELENSLLVNDRAEGDLVFVDESNDGLIDLDEEFENPTYMIPGIDDEDGYDYV